MPAFANLANSKRVPPDLFFFGVLDMGGILMHILSACAILLDAAIIFTVFSAFAKSKNNL